MRSGKPSFTAAAVATARGIAKVDPYAARLVDGPLSWVLRAGRRGRLAAATINAATLGLVDHIEMRTRAIDEAVRDSSAAQLRQLVILGAGLDARAWRMNELRDVVVFEVDHPSTQAYKRPRVSSRVPAAREVRFVAVDFERDSLADQLERSGHDAGIPTFWLWEGVTPYLARDAVRATLGAVATRSAPQSRICVSYAVPRTSPLGPGVLRLAQAGFRLMGEELRGLIDTDAMHAELEAAGFGVIDDASAIEWAARFGAGRRRWMLLDERLAVGLRDPARPAIAVSAPTR